MHEYSGTPDKYPNGPLNGHGAKIVWSVLILLSISILCWLVYVDWQTKKDWNDQPRPIAQFERKELITSRLDEKTGQIIEALCPPKRERCYYRVRFPTDKGYGTFHMEEFEIQSIKEQ